MLTRLHVSSVNSGEMIEDRAVEVEENGAEANHRANLRPERQGMHGKICGLWVSPQE